MNEFVTSNKGDTTTALPHLYIDLGFIYFAYKKTINIQRSIIYTANSIFHLEQQIEQTLQFQNVPQLEPLQD